MFDISFGELALCLVVALVILGPERLPKVARTVGRWMGQAKSYVANVSSELEKESQVMDIKRQLEEARSALKDAERSVQKETSAISKDFSENLRKKL